ncbi:MAG: DUF255 domain-containing protein [Bacteroidia bacterium]
MKLVYTLSLLLISSLTLSFTPPVSNPAEELNWFGWNEGYDKAEETNKIALIDVYTDWCGWCKRMDRDTYANSEVMELIEADFIPIKFNPEKDGTYNVNGEEVSGPQLLAMLGNNQRFGYPTTFFIFPKERQITIEVGYKDAASFKAILTRVKEAHAKLDSQPIAD